jgi:hypothetical protein
MKKCADAGVHIIGKAEVKLDDDTKIDIIMYTAESYA